MLSHNKKISGIIAFSLITATTTYALAEPNSTRDMIMTSTITQERTFPIKDYIPTGYQKTGQRAITVDSEKATLTRYERIDGRNAGFGGEHFSVVIADNGRLKGFVRIDLDLVGRALPSKEDAQQIAMDFLQQQAPDLRTGMELHWIDTHDEPLRVTHDGKAKDLILTGMKVKMRNTTDGRWFWVIVGADHKVMAFERDIHWISFPGRRGTEKWLHDSWMLKKGYTLDAI
jgi:hypothetical protein